MTPPKISSSNRHFARNFAVLVTLCPTLFVALSTPLLSQTPRPKQSVNSRITQHQINEYAAYSADALDGLRALKSGPPRESDKDWASRMKQVVGFSSTLTLKFNQLEHFATDHADSSASNKSRWSQIGKIVQVLPSRTRQISRILLKLNREAKDRDIADHELRSLLDNVQSALNLLRDARP